MFNIYILSSVYDWVIRPYGCHKEYIFLSFSFFSWIWIN